MPPRNVDFVGQLKIAWDTRLKKNRRLTLAAARAASSKALAMTK